VVVAARHRQGRLHGERGGGYRCRLFLCVMMGQGVVAWRRTTGRKLCWCEGREGSSLQTFGLPPVGCILVMHVGRGCSLRLCSH